jgi:hypothetical protein
MIFLKKKQIMLALVIVLSVPAPSPANASVEIFGAMFRMMLVMMNTMSDAMLGNNNDMGWGSASPLGMGMTTLPMMSGMYGMNPQTGFGGMSPSSTPFNSRSNPFTNAYPSYANKPYGNRHYGGYYPETSGSPLDGRWYGNSGEVLEVRGNRFRLLDIQFGINGEIRIENNIVSLYSPQTGSVTQYSFTRNQSELMLQDATGRVLGFRRRPNNPASYRF